MVPYRFTLSGMQPHDLHISPILFEIRHNSADLLSATNNQEKQNYITFPLAVSANQHWIPQFQQFLRALTVHIRRMIVLLTK